MSELSYYLDYFLEYCLGNENVAVALLLVGIVLLVAISKAIFSHRKKEKRIKKNRHEKAKDNPESDDEIAENNQGKFNQLVIVNNRIRSEKWHFDMTGNVIIGSSAARCDIAFEQDKALASRHAVITFANKTAYISPVSPSFEVYVQDELVTDKVELGPQQVITLGNQALRVIYE